MAHPVFRFAATPAQLAGLRARLRTLLALPESRLLALIPTRTGFISCDCPNCDQGVQGSQLQWTLEEPAVLTCRYCGHRYPSAKYPDDRLLEVKDPLGRLQQYPYYQDAAGRKYFFQARGWRLARDSFMLAGHDAAQVYALTGEKTYARRAALILDRFAELYPGFVVVRESAQEDQGFQDRPPYETQGGKWGRWYFDEIPTPLIRAYDLIYPEVDPAARRRIEEDFFRGVVRHVRTYPELYANPSPRIYEGLATLGRVLGEPEYVHDAVRRIQGLFEKRFFFDGMWKEGTFGYHDMTMRGVEAALAAVGDPKLEAEIPMLARARVAADRLRYPDGRPLPLHDSWARVRGAYVKAAPLERSSPALWPAMGHAYLGRGRGVSQMQVHLHFGGGYGHAHNDSLNLALFAHGEELLPDLGYSHTRYRTWTRSTLAHNTVLVDGREQYTGSEEKPSDGNLLLFAAAGDDLQLVEASGERAYPGLVTAYRRRVLLVGVDEHRAYLVDVFRVEGGQRHEWVLHGSADHDQRLSVNAQLETHEASLLPSGVPFQPPRTEYENAPAYGFVRDVRRGTAPEPLVATFEPAADPGAALRVHGFAPAGTTLLTGRAPSIRRGDENDARVEQFWMPVLVLRSEHPANSFVSVLEPFEKQPLIRSVEKRGEVLTIAGEGWTDQISLGSELTWTREGGKRLRLARVMQGRVTGVRRGALEVDAELPPGLDLAGLTAVVRHGDSSTHGYPLREVQRDAGRLLLVLTGEPGFEMDAAGRCRFLYFPQREIEGGATCSVHTLASF